MTAFTTTHFMRMSRGQNSSGGLNREPSTPSKPAPMLAVRPLTPDVKDLSQNGYQ